MWNFLALTAAIVYPGYLRYQVCLVLPLPRLSVDRAHTSRLSCGARPEVSER